MTREPSDDGTGVLVDERRRPRFGSTSGTATGSAPSARLSCWTMTRAWALIAGTIRRVLKNQGRSDSVSLTSIIWPSTGAAVRVVRAAWFQKARVDEDVDVGPASVGATWAL